MEEKNYKIEKTIAKNIIPPTIAPIRNLNSPKISQEIIR